MSDSRPTLLGRLARLGPVGLFQRARNLLLRPVRHELADARREIAADALLLRQDDANLRQDAARLREEVAALRQGLSDLHRELAATREQARRELQAHLSAPLREIGELTARQRLLESLVTQGFGALPVPHAGPLVSIVLATRNRAGCLGEAIDSVLLQGYPRWELLVVDDGSEDDTAAVLARYDDPRVRSFAIAHAGPSAARNHALHRARGEIVTYLDSDNTWFPGFLAGMVAAFAADPALELGYGVLASEAHAPGSLVLLAPDFDRGLLEAANYIDLNAVAHRRSLYERLGGFDESLRRMVDWDLLLRYTADRDARLLPVLAARYRVRDRQRISESVPSGPSWLAIRNRLDAAPAPARAPRALYVLWHYPQLSETYVEGEIRYLLRQGVEIAVWHAVGAVTPYRPQVPMHSGDIDALVREFQPDVIHVHWLQFALENFDRLQALGVPVTVRMHGFDVHADAFHRLLGARFLHRVYAFPRQLQLLEAPDPRVRAVPSAFDTSYFSPAAQKDPRLVVRAGACLPSKDIPLFFELAKRLPTHRFVFAGIKVNLFEGFPEQLREIAAALGSPVELRFDLPREEVAGLIARAGIYLHTICPPDAPHGAPIGQPISIAEAMATGAWVLARDEPELAEYVGDAGATYAGIDEAEARIRETMDWSPEEWRARAVRASDRGYWNHADEVVLRPVYEDWKELATRVATGARAEPA
jgi:glycosyltransferase involved in cell wall biosynthesis